jgi:hypothetical protein
MNETVQVTYKFGGDLDKKVEEVTLGIKGLRDESESTFRRLLESSDNTFNSMSENNRRLAVSIQENINTLRQLSATEESLENSRAQGNISTAAYLETKAKLVVRENELREAIITGTHTLNERIGKEKEAVGSLNSLRGSMMSLVDTYRSMSKADRDGEAGSQLLTKIQNLDKEIGQAESRLAGLRSAGGTTFNSLNMSVQQVARELPSLTMGVNTFFLAISNNMPILIDDVKRARQQYALLKAEGQAATPVWKQLASSIISWQTALVVAITMLSMYGKDIIAWGQDLFSANKSQRLLTESLQEFNEELLKERQSLEEVFSRLNKTKEGTEGRRKAINQINDLYGKYLPNLLSEKSSLDEVNAAYKRITASIRENAAAKAQASATSKVADKALKTQAEALTSMRNELKGQDTGFIDRLISDIMDLTEESERAGLGFQKTWSTVLGKVQYETKGIKIDSDFYGSLEDYIKSYLESEKKIKDIQKQYNPFFNKEEAEKAITENKEYWEEVKKQAESVLENISAEQKKLLDAGKTTGISKTTVTAYKEVRKNIEEATAALKAYDSYDKQGKEATRSMSKEQREKEKANAVKAEAAMRLLEVERGEQSIAEAKSELELKNQASEIARMKDGAAKELRQIDLEYQQKLSSIRKYEQNLLQAQQELEKKKWEMENPDWKKKGLEFTPKTTSADQLPSGIRREIDDSRDNAALDADKAKEDVLKKMLEKYQDYDSQRRKIEEKFTADYRFLSSQRTETNSSDIDAALIQLEKDKKKALSAISFDELKDSDLWTAIFSDLGKKSLPVLEELQVKAREVNTSTWTPENVKEYQEAINRLEKEIRSRSPFKAIRDDWNKLLKAIKGKDGKVDKNAISEALSNIDEEIQSVLSSLSTVSGGVGDIFGSDAGYAAEQTMELASALGGVATGAARFASGDILGGVTSVVSSIGKVFAMGKKVKEMNRLAREENQKFYDNAMEGEKEYQKMIRERLRLEQQIGETSLKYNKRITTELKQQSGDVQKEYEKIWAELQGEEFISGKGYKHGTWFRKAKTWNIYSSLAGKSYDDIEKLYTEGRLEKKVAKLFEQLKALKEEGADIDQMLADQAESMREAWTGTTSDSIADSILQGFAEGKRSAADFADSFEEMLNNAVLQGIKLRALEEPLRQWYEKFAQASEGGLTEDKIASLKAEYDKVIENAARQLEEAEKITGLDISGVTGTSRQATAKGITSMSQESASELNGNFYALLQMADKTCQGVNSIQSMITEGLSVLGRIEENTSHCKRLEKIENDMEGTRRTLQEILNKGLILRKAA